MLSLNSVTKIFVITIKKFERATSCVKYQDAITAPARHVRDRTFKLSPIHASVIFLKSLNSMHLLISCSI